MRSLRSALIFVLLPATCCWAQQNAAVPLTLAECQRLALAVPSTVTLARQDATIARLGVAVARANFLPQTGLNTGYTRASSGGAQTTDTGSLLSAPGSNQSFVSLNGTNEYISQAASSIEIDTSGRLRAAYARAKADVRIADVNVSIIQRDLRRTVAAAFYRLLLTRHLVTANRGVLAEARSFLTRTQQLFEGGEVAQADVIKAASQVAFLEQAVNQSELDARQANQDLAQYWTDDVESELAVEDTLESPAPPATEPANPTPFRRRFEFNLYEAQVEGFRADARRERALLFPQLTYNYQYGIDANTLSFGNRGQASFFTFNIPLFDWFRARSLSRQFTIRAEQVQANRDISTRSFSRDYRSALARVERYFQQISLTDTQVKTSTDNLRLARVRYEGGEGPALDVVAAQTQLAQAQNNYFTALANYANARADLEVAAGR